MSGVDRRFAIAVPASQFANSESLDVTSANNLDLERAPEFLIHNHTLHIVLW